MAPGPPHERKEEFEEVALPHLDALFHLALSLTRNRTDAEDLVQDHPPEYRPLLLSADQRGRRLRISGEYSVRLRTVRLDRVEPLGAGL